MKKNNITLVFVAIVFSIIVGMIIGKSLLKYKEGKPDVVGSFSMNRDENLTVVCIFRKNRALAPHERSAVPLGTDHCPVC